MKRFRIRPQRASDHHLVWLGGPDCGLTGKIKPLTIKRDCGAAIDSLLGRKHRRNIEKLTRRMGPPRPHYPEH